MSSTDWPKSGWIIRKKTINDKIIYELIVEISDYLKVCNEMMEDKINSYSKNIEDKKHTKLKSFKRLTEN